MTAVAVAAVGVAAFIWVWEWQRPPADRAAHRRLLHELARHPIELWEHEDAA